MDRIVLAGMEFHGYHGVFDEEARFGARFVVDVEMQVEVSGVDELAETVDYSRVYELVRQEVTGRRYRLIEALAHALTGGILASEQRVAAVTVRVHKPHAPLPGLVRDVYVELHRAR
jgi:dihydroneopterin aldolase